MKKTIILFIVTMLVASCNSQTKETKMKIQEPIRKNQDTLYTRYLPLMEKLLKSNNYKVLEHDDFKNKIQEYFGVDIDKSKYNDVFLGGEGYGYTAMNNERFIDTYTEGDRGDIEGAGDAFGDGLKERIEDDYYNFIFVYFNKILLNDDLSAIFKINSDSNATEKIVVNLDYEKNNILENTFIKNLKELDAYNDDFKFHLLWYNDRSKSEIIRKKLLGDVLNKKLDFIFDLTLFLYTNSNNIKDKADIRLINETLAYLIEIQLQHYDDKDLSDNKGYTLLNHFYLETPKLLDNFKSEKYYGYPLIDIYTKKYLLMSEENEISYGKVIDSDGYTNLRKEKNAQSTILQKITTGSQVEVLDNSGDWWLVKTKEGKKGYVFKTKIKAN